MRRLLPFLLPLLVAGCGGATFNGGGRSRCLEGDQVAPRATAAEQGELAALGAALDAAGYERLAPATAVSPGQVHVEEHPEPFVLAEHDGMLLVVTADLSRRTVVPVRDGAGQILVVEIVWQDATTETIVQCGCNPNHGGARQPDVFYALYHMPDGIDEVAGTRQLEVRRDLLRVSYTDQIGDDAHESCIPRP